MHQLERPCLQEGLYGEQLLFRLVVDCLAQDAAARLAVFRARMQAQGQLSQQVKHELEILLTQSELWRIIAPVSRLTW